MPGEVAPSHRHNQSALRFIVEGKGAFTAVDGERTQMHEGDFILTPQWCWHDHGNPGEEAVVWLDGLDLPLVNLLGCGFAEDYPQEQQPVTRQEGIIYLAMRPICCRCAIRKATRRLFSTTATIAVGKRCTTSPAWGSRRVGWLQDALRQPGDRRLSHALDGRLPATAAERLFLTEGAHHGQHHLPRGGRARPGQHRQRNHSLLAKDIFVAPTWFDVSFQADEDTVLFSFSDRPVQEALGLFREARY